MKHRRLFTRSQWIFLLFVLNITLVVAGTLLLSRYHNNRGDGASETLGRISSREKESIIRYSTPSSPPKSFLFDPNEADSTQLLSLGLAPFQVRSIYRYRAKGGRFSCKEDFKRVYRLTNEQWEHLSPLIRIDRKYQLVEPPVTIQQSTTPPSKDTSSSRKDTLTTESRTSSSSAAKKGSYSKRYAAKLSGDELVNVNIADSALLCRIPGIGPYFARRILWYRNKLGGLVNVEQLLEIEDFPADALAWMEVGDTATTITKLHINKLSVRKLSKHPYMGYYRAAEIADYRRIHGSVPNVHALESMPHFTPEDIRRILPYISFD